MQKALTAYPSFLTGLPHSSTSAAQLGSISVYSDLLQQQLSRSEAMHGHTSLLNNSLGHSTEDEMDSSGASKKQLKINKKQSKQRNSKVKLAS